MAGNPAIRLDALAPFNCAVTAAAAGVSPAPVELGVAVIDGLPDGNS